MNKKYSQIKAMLAISRASLTSIRRNPSSIVFSIIFPLVFIVVFGFIGGNSFNVEVGVTKGTDINNPVYEKIKSINTVKLRDGMADEELYKKLETGKIDAVLNISKNT